MFAFIFDSVGFGEWFVLLAVVLIVVGPKRLPETARKLGQYYAKFRRAAESFKRQLLDMDTEFGRTVHDVQRAADDFARGATEVLEPEKTASVQQQEETASVRQQEETVS